MDKHSCIGTVTRECPDNSGNCGQIFRERSAARARTRGATLTRTPTSNARVEPQTVDVNKLCELDRFGGCESGKYGSTICFCPSSEVDKCVEQKQAMKYSSTLAAWIAPKEENCKLDEDSVQLAPVAAVEAASSTCGSTLIWLESGITQESLNDVVANQAALGNTGTVELVIYCDLWETDGLGLPSAHILKALTNGGTLDYRLRVRKGGPPCTNPEVLSKVAGTAIDPEDGSERSITAEEALVVFIDRVPQRHRSHLARVAVAHAEHLFNLQQVCVHVADAACVHSSTIGRTSKFALRRRAERNLFLRSPAT